MLLLSALGVLLLVGLAWALGFRDRPVLDRDAARREAELVLAGFRAVDAWLAAGGRGALVRGADGAIAALLPKGDGWLVRRLPGAPRPYGAGVRLPLDEPGLRRPHLPAAGPLPAWVRS